MLEEVQRFKWKAGASMGHLQLQEEPQNSKEGSLREGTQLEGLRITELGWWLRGKEVAGLEQ